MTFRVDVKPELLRWAMERSGKNPDKLEKQFPKLQVWLEGKTRPTFKQAESFAKANYTAVGHLISESPPDEPMPIPDFRTMSGKPVRRPSGNLLDTIYLCQQRQNWYQEYALVEKLEPLDFIGSVNLSTPIERVAKEIRDTLLFDLDARRSMQNWEEARRSFMAHADNAGILVMCNSIVLSNAHRRLDPEEFRGFALSDKLAPLVFINGADTKSAQMFTLAHELAHLWLGTTALSSADISGQEDQDVERWCNAVAAELLVPLSIFRAELKDEDLGESLQRLARRFKVSTLVILRRMLDARHLSRKAYHKAYASELDRILSLPKSAGGSFYLSLPYRTSRRFAQALIASTLGGQTLYRDAMRLLGVRKLITFDEIGRGLGVMT